MNITITTTAKTTPRPRRCFARSGFRSRTEDVQQSLGPSKALAMHPINRNEKRKKLVAKFAKKRDALPGDHRRSHEGFGRGRATQARLKIQALPRNANKTRIRNRCALTGRPRGVYSKFGLGRNRLRE